MTKKKAGTRAKPVEKDEEKKPEGEANGASRGLGYELWHLFSSVKLALFLMLALTFLSLLGALLIQVPQDVAADPAEYARWLEAVRARLGFWTPLLAGLGFFNMFRSFWFLALSGLLMLNILVCSLNRWKSLGRAISGGAVRLPDAFYSGPDKAELSTAGTVLQASEAAFRVLQRHGFRVRREEAAKVYLAADKNRYFRLGTYLSHLSIILLIPAILIGIFFGFRDEYFIVPEGATREVGFDTRLSLRLESFTDEYYLDGVPRDYRSEVVLYDAGREVSQGTVRVNYPLSYNGVRFFQSFFGPAVQMEVRSAGGEVIFREGVALPDTQDLAGVRHTGSFELPQELRGTLFTSTLSGTDPMIKPGELGVVLYQGGSDTPLAMDKLVKATPRPVGGLEFTYVADTQFSGFQVSHDPGNFLIWIASTLFVLGVGMVLYFPHRQLWLMLEPRAGGGTRLLARSGARSRPDEVKGLLREMETELKKK